MLLIKALPLAQAMVERVRGGRFRARGLEAGVVNENDLDEMAKAWEEWPGKEDSSIAMLQGEIVIQK